MLLKEQQFTELLTMHYMQYSYEKEALSKYASFYYAAYTVHTNKNDIIPKEKLFRQRNSCNKCIIIIIFFLPEVDIYDPSGDIIVIIEYFCLEGQASSSVAEGKLP